VEKRAEFFNQLLDEWEVNDFEAQFRRKDNKILTTLVSAKLLSYKNSPHLLAVTKDITELKQARDALVEAHKKLEKRYEDSAEKLKETEVKYSALLEALLVGVYMCEANEIIFVNNQFAEMLGYTKDELLAMNLMDVIYPEDRANFITVCGMPAPGEYAEGEFEVRGVRKNGDIIYLSGRNTIIEFNDKKGFLGNITDITRRKEAEKELQRSEEDLRILSTQLLSAEERERKRIARDIHDSIGQAFSAIKFSIENSLLAIGEKSYLTAQKALENLIPLTQQSIDEVRRIIMDLRPSTLDDLGLIATISWFSRELEAIYTDIQIEKEINLEEADIPRSLKTVIYRILQEALNNAAKHNNKNIIRIQLKKHADRLKLVIEDKGVGFDLEQQQAKLPNEKGMGLTSMKERAQLSGGTFTIHSAPGKGTRIDIGWPLKDMD
jgi:PAS domain S-box-containing protein